MALIVDTGGSPQKNSCAA